MDHGKNWVIRSVYSSWQQALSWWCGFWNPAHGNKKTWNSLAHDIIIRPHPNNEQCFSYFLTKRFQESSLPGALVGLPAITATLEFYKNYRCNKGNSTQNGRMSFSADYQGFSVEGWVPTPPVPALWEEEVWAGVLQAAFHQQGWSSCASGRRGRGPFHPQVRE